jgi:hypothetical protein
MTAEKSISTAIPTNLVKAYYRVTPVKAVLEIIFRISDLTLDEFVALWFQRSGGSWLTQKWYLANLQFSKLNYMGVRDIAQLIYCTK